MGPSPRGGAYTYDWIENVLGLDMHSADRVLPEFQHPQVGDTIGYGPNRMRLERVEPEHVLAWRSEDGNWVWSFVLDEQHGQTRLISRNRFRLPSLSARIGMVPMEPASLVMERKMLYGIEATSRTACGRYAVAGLGQNESTGRLTAVSEPNVVTVFFAALVTALATGLGALPLLFVRSAGRLVLGRRTRSRRG